MAAASWLRTCASALLFFLLSGGLLQGYSSTKKISTTLFFVDNALQADEKLLLVVDNKANDKSTKQQQQEQQQEEEELKDTSTRNTTHNSPSSSNLWNTNISTAASNHTTNSPIATNTTNPPLLPGRRSKVHWCYHVHHMERPMNILQSEFGLNQNVNAMMENDWDVIFGGYPHCGKGGKHGKGNDWTMEHGLNQYLTRQGWHNLKWHQVWFPCMGCAQSYCNKRDLCPLLKTLDDSLCYELPEDLERLHQAMSVTANNNQTNNWWVVKQDSHTKNVYGGKGVQFIRHASELPSAEQMADGTYLVQKFIDQWMGPLGTKYYRRHEVKLFLAVTSTSPLRVYSYSELWGNFAWKNFVDDPPPPQQQQQTTETTKSSSSSFSNNNNNSNSNSNTVMEMDLCMLDTHGKNHACQPEGMSTKERQAIAFDDLTTMIDLPSHMQQRFLNSAKQIIAQVMIASQPIVLASPVNQGITHSGAMCFSFLRADLAITATGDAALYEINEFPHANDKPPVASRIQTQAYRDLFRMIGMDVAPLPVSQRQDYELSHLGGWEPLILDGKPRFSTSWETNNGANDDDDDDNNTATIHKDAMTPSPAKLFTSPGDKSGGTSTPRHPAADRNNGSGMDLLLDHHLPPKTCEERQKILERAQEWARDKVQYNFHTFHKGYRAQCSGFVAFAGNLAIAKPSDTPRCYEFEKRGQAVPIPKEELRPGDLMVCNPKKNRIKKSQWPKKENGQQPGGHCLLFEQWVDNTSNQTNYLGWELCDDASCHDVVRREIPYPYFYKQSCWEPMRFTSLGSQCREH